ncbi:MAG: ECF transporter S component [Eubacteriales bacterium]
MRQPFRPLGGHTRKLVMTALLSAVAYLLMLLEFPLPLLLPDFIKFDLSEVPALLASFSMGPLWGALVCLLKNLFKLSASYSGGIGELANFLMGVFFVVPAGFLYRWRKTKQGALLGMMAGSLCMAVSSFPINYFITYPVYAKLMPLDIIIGAYQAILPSVDGLVACLLIFNLPFTLMKALVCTAVVSLIYKRLSPLIRGQDAYPTTTRAPHSPPPQAKDGE